MNGLYETDDVRVYGDDIGPHDMQIFDVVDDTMHLIVNTWTVLLGCVLSISFQDVSLLQRIYMIVEREL